MPTEAPETGDALSSDADDSFLRDVAGMAVSTAPAPLTPGLTIDDAYQIVRNVGAGGMGAVYLARDLRDGRDVAIKVLRHSKSDARRFARETTILAELSHPAIVRYRAHGVLDGGAPYLVMDWVDGETLDAHLRGGGLTVGEAVAVARRIAGALGFAHARGVVHRDIKPSNLIFAGGDLARATILDFGIARTAAQVGNLTETGAVLGTPSYMAPEQVRGARDVGPRADVFALGCVLYECVGGRRAFEAARMLALRAKILLFEPRPLHELAYSVSPELEAVVARMLAKDPAGRPADGAEVEAMLAALPPALDPTRRPRRHHAGAAALGLPVVPGL